MNLKTLLNASLIFRYSDSDVLPFLYLLINLIKLSDEEEFFPLLITEKIVKMEELLTTMLVVCTGWLVIDIVKYLQILT